MPKNNSEHIIEEIQANVQAGDVLKGKLVLSHIDELDAKMQKRVVYEVSRGEVEFAVPLLVYLLTEKANVAEELPVIRDSLLSNLLAYPEALPTFLNSEVIGDKSELIRIIGELSYSDATPALLDRVAATEDESEVLLIIETLGLLGDPEAIHTLTDYLYSANREMITAAVHSLGKVATPSAMHRLAERMGTDNEIDFLILSIFAQVQDQVSLEKLNDTLRSYYAHMRSYAKQELVNIGPKAVPILIENLINDDPDFLIHSLNVLGDIGDESAIVPIRKLIETMPRSANVRFATYEALALLPVRRGAYTLTAGLTDPEEHVCIAAAKAIDRNFSEVLGIGIRNLLQGPEKEAAHIARIIVTAQVDKIFGFLASDERFQKLAADHLSQAHKDTRDHYHSLLVAAGLQDFAEELEKTIEQPERPKVVAVDDSRMILNIYKSTLHELGYDPVLFEFPASALEWLDKEQPLMVLTDLNMPEITGVELTRRIRTKYNAGQLPVIMVTTQNEARDNIAAERAGVSAILHKPFNVESLGRAMQNVLR